MDELIKIRHKIDDIDSQMIALFEKRIKLVNNVIKIKLKNGTPILDKKREEEMLTKVSSLCEDQSYLKYCELFLTSLMDVSKSFQQDVLNKTDI